MISSKILKWWKEYKEEPVRDIEEQEVKLRKILKFKDNKRIDKLRFVYDNNSLNERSENILLDLIKEFGGEIQW